MNKKSNNPIPFLTWAEIDLKAVKYNLKQIAKLTSKAKYSLPTRRRTFKMARNNKIVNG